VPGVTAQGDLTSFWNEPGQVVPENFELLRKALRAKCLVNGCFHSRQGLARLVETSAERLLRE